MTIRVYGLKWRLIDRLCAPDMEIVSSGLAGNTLNTEAILGESWHFLA